MRSQILEAISLSRPSADLSIRKKPDGQKAGKPEETLIIDERATTRPAEIVENKLCQLIKGLSVGVSHLQLKRLIAQRFSV